MTVTFLMDGKEVTAQDGQTLLDVARENCIDIPTICFHEATTANALCRICVVEVEGMRVLQPSCVVKAGANMKVQTRSELPSRTNQTGVFTPCPFLRNDSRLRYDLPSNCCSLLSIVSPFCDDLLEFGESFL